MLLNHQLVRLVQNSKTVTVVLALNVLNVILDLNKCPIIHVRVFLQTVVTKEHLQLLFSPHLLYHAGIAPPDVQYVLLLTIVSMLLNVCNAQVLNSL